MPEDAYEPHRTESQQKSGDDSRQQQARARSRKPIERKDRVLGFWLRYHRRRAKDQFVQMGHSDFQVRNTVEKGFDLRQTPEEDQYRQNDPWHPRDECLFSAMVMAWIADCHCHISFVLEAPDRTRLPEFE